MNDNSTVESKSVTTGSSILTIGAVVFGALVILIGGALIGWFAAGGPQRGAASNAAIQPPVYGPGMMQGYGYDPRGNDGQAPRGNFGPGMMGGYEEGYGYGPGSQRNSGPGMMQGRGEGYGYGPGRMQGNGGGYGYGPGMMGGNGGMMGGYVPDPDLIPAQGESLTIDQAMQVAEAYAAQLGDGLEVTEVMEFDNHFYAEIHETESGIGATEILIDPATASVHPEPGPNMMWNTKYGMMGGGRGMMNGYLGSPTAEMTITPEKAIELAQQSLDEANTGLTAADDAETFYGYYTIHTMKDGEIAGMLGVNGYTGEVWVHTWHGTFVGMTGE